MNLKTIANNALVAISAQKKVDAGTVLHNMNGASEKSAKCDNCGSWIDHWHRLSGQAIPADGDCAVLGCTGRDKDGKKLSIEGCHVKVDGSDDCCVYIAPLCKGCNAKHGQNLTLKRGITFVWANVNATCSKLIDED